MLITLTLIIMDKTFMMKEIARNQKAIERKSQEIVEHQASIDFFNSQLSVPATPIPTPTTGK
jgi:hypothetical protein